MNYCPHCGHKKNKYQLFENSFEPQQDNNFNVPSSPDFERLVKIPFSQSAIYGLSFGLLAGLLAVSTFGIIAIPVCILISWIVAWTLISNLFNRVILHSIFPQQLPAEVDTQEIVTMHNIIQENGSSIKRGNIRADAKQISEWSRIVSLDLSIGGRENVSLTHNRFTKDHKIFSQPAYKKYLEDIEHLGIIRRKNPDAKNSPFMLTSTGMSFIEQNRG